MHDALKQLEDSIMRLTPDTMSVAQSDLNKAKAVLRLFELDTLDFAHTLLNNPEIRNVKNVWDLVDFMRSNSLTFAPIDDAGINLYIELRNAFLKQIDALGLKEDQEKRVEPLGVVKVGDNLLDVRNQMDWKKAGNASDFDISLKNQVSTLGKTDLVNTKGTLTRQLVVPMDATHLTFTIDGGHNKDLLYLRVRSGATEICTQSGPGNDGKKDKPAKDHQCDIREYQGKSITIEIVDRASKKDLPKEVLLSLKISSSRSDGRPVDC